MNFPHKSPSSLTALGSKHGYQHLYVEGEGKPAAGTTQFSWLDNGKFYTLSSVTDANDELLLTRIGAHDPDFNLRREAAIMIRRKDSQNTVFASVIEPHGSYSPVSESSLNAKSNIAELKVEHNDENYTAISIKALTGSTSLFILANLDASATKKHELRVNGKVYRWTGAYYFIESVI
jgi:hypothetical protein